jgi:hypothetical protein
VGKLFDTLRDMMGHGQEQMMRDDNHALALASIGDRHRRIVQQLEAGFWHRVTICAGNDHVRIPPDELLAADLAKACHALFRHDVDDAEGL